MLESLFDVPVAFAFGAGMVAAFNPCGAAMLPAYVGYQLSIGAETSNPLSAVMRGFYLGGVVTAGFVIRTLYPASIALGSLLFSTLLGASE